MSGTDELIAGLAADLSPVEPVAPLWRVAARILAVGVGAIAITQVFAFAAGLSTSQPTGRADLLAFGAHLLLASGALGGALASSIPGRGRGKRSAARWGPSASHSRCSWWFLSF